MSDQPLLDLIEAGAGRKNRNRNYHDSKPRHPSQRAKVLQWLDVVTDATREEIASALGIPLASVCGRVSELVKSGEVVETKNRRETTNGKFAVVLMTKRNQ